MVGVGHWRGHQDRGPPDAPEAGEAGCPQLRMAFPPEGGFPAEFRVPGRPGFPGEPRAQRKPERRALVSTLETAARMSEIRRDNQALAFKQPFLGGGRNGEPVKASAPGFPPPGSTRARARVIATKGGVKPKPSDPRFSGGFVTKQTRPAGPPSEICEGSLPGRGITAPPFVERGGLEAPAQPFSTGGWPPPDAPPFGGLATKTSRPGRPSLELGKDRGTILGRWKATIVPAAGGPRGRVSWDPGAGVTSVREPWLRGREIPPFFFGRSSSRRKKALLG